MAARVKSRAYKHAPISGRDPALWSVSFVCSEKSHELGAQIVESTVVRRSSGIQNEIKSCGNHRTRCSKNFSNPSFYSISLVGLAQLSRGRQAEPAVIQPIRQRKQHKGARHPSCAPLINLLKLCRIPQPNVFRECICSGNRHNLNTLIVFDRDTFPAFIASSF